MPLPLSVLVSKLQALAPLRYAEQWDNVGLLIDPRATGTELEVSRAMLCIDATAQVLNEAARNDVQCLIAYHPPLFRPKKQLSRRMDAVVFEAILRGYAVYSPHTALDAAPAGLNDWLVAGFGPGIVRPLLPHSQSVPDAEFKLSIFLPPSAVDSVRDALSEAGAGKIGSYSHCSFELAGAATGREREHKPDSADRDSGRYIRFEETRLEMVCGLMALGAVREALQRAHPSAEPNWELSALAPKPELRAGKGRVLELASPTSLDELVARIKRHLGLAQVCVARAPAHAGTLIRRVAAGAGASGALFGAPVDADLFLTGEMAHHDILAKLAQGKSVIVCGHTNTERGYLPVLRERLLSDVGDHIEIAVAISDTEPLCIV